MSKPFMNIAIGGNALLRGKSPIKAIREIKAQETAAKKVIEKGLGAIAKSLLNDEANFSSVNLGFSNYQPSTLTKIKWFLKDKFKSVK